VLEKLSSYVNQQGGPRVHRRREQVTGSPAQIAGSDMSGTAPGASTTASSSGLFDETGRPIPSQTEQTLEPLVRFVKEQPVAAALAALVIGYILGKIF
jgi:hypothetical protein